MLETFKEPDLNFILMYPKRYFVTSLLFCVDKIFFNYDHLKKLLISNWDLKLFFVDLIVSHKIEDLLRFLLFFSFVFG